MTGTAGPNGFRGDPVKYLVILTPHSHHICEFSGADKFFGPFSFRMQVNRLDHAHHTHVSHDFCVVKFYFSQYNAPLMDRYGPRMHDFYVNEVLWSSVFS